MAKRILQAAAHSPVGQVAEIDKGENEQVAVLCLAAYFVKSRQVEGKGDSKKNVKLRSKKICHSFEGKCRWEIH